MDVGSIANIGVMNLGTQIGVAMLNNNMEAMEAAGQGLIHMIESAPSAAAMERSVNPHIGGNIDILV